MNDEFPSNALLELREKREEEAMAALASASAAERTVAEAIGRLETRLDRLAGQIADARPEYSSDLAAMQRADRYVRALEEELASARRELEQLEAERDRRAEAVTAARKSAADAAAATGAIRSRREAWESERRRAERRKEDAALDELAIRKWTEG